MKQLIQFGTQVMPEIRYSVRCAKDSFWTLTASLRSA
jgi:hypothetical protein